MTATAKIVRRFRQFWPLPLLSLLTVSAPMRLSADDPPPATLSGTVGTDGSKPPWGFYLPPLQSTYVDHPSFYQAPNPEWPLGNRLPDSGTSSFSGPVAAHEQPALHYVSGLVPGKRLQWGDLPAEFHLMAPYFTADKMISCPSGGACSPALDVTLYAKWGNVVGSVKLEDGTPVPWLYVNATPADPVPQGAEQAFRPKNVGVNSRGNYTFTGSTLIQDNPTAWQCAPPFNLVCEGLPFDILNNWGLRVLGDGGGGPVLDRLLNSNAPGLFNWRIYLSDKHSSTVEVTSSQAELVNFRLTLDEAFEALEWQAENRPPENDDPEAEKDPCGLGAGAAPHPVSLITGNVFVDQTDGRLKGLRHDVLFTRSYNSHNRFSDPASGAMGRGWNHAFEKRIEAVTDSILRLWGSNGAPNYYTDPDGDSVFQPYGFIDPPSTLTKLGDGSYRRVFRTGGYEEYGSDGRLLKRADRLGRATTLTYAGSLLATIETPEGRTLQLDYMGGEQVRRVTGPEGVVAEYDYGIVQTGLDYWYELRQVRYPGGTGHRFSYDQNGRLLTVSNLAGVVLDRHGYDQQGKAAWSELNAGRERRSYVYEDGQTRVTDARNGVALFGYTKKKARRFVTQITGCSFCGIGSGTRTWSVDDQGRVLSSTDADNNQTTYVWQGGNLMSRRNALDQTTTFADHDEYGRPRTITQPYRGVVRATYGLAGVTSVALPTGTAVFTYENQRLRTVTTRGGLVYTLEIDDRGDLLSVIDPRGKRTSATYDAMGRVTSVTSPLNKTTRYHRDAAGRLTAIERPDGEQRRFDYDASGRLASMTDEAGRVSRYSYDAYARPEAAVDPLGGVTRLAYDLMSNVASLTDAKGQKTGFEYDDVGRVTAVVDPMQGREVYTYYPSGRLWTRTDRKAVTTTYTYDGLGRLASKTYSDGTPAVSISFDDPARRMTAWNGTDSLTWQFDESGRLQSETSAFSGSTVSYTYNGDHQRETLSLDGALLARSVYVSGYLETLQAFGQQFGFSYDDLGRRTSLRYPNGLETSYTFQEDQGWLRRVTTLSGAATLFEASYSHDLVGNRLSKVLPEASESYGYDALDRLRRVSRTSESWAFGFDAVGNRTTEQVDGETSSESRRFSLDARNRLLGSVPGPLRVSGTTSEAAQVTVGDQTARSLPGNVFEADVEPSSTLTVTAKDPSGNERTNQYQIPPGPGPVSYSYDSNGNLTSKSDNGIAWAYEWNAENQLTRVLKDGAEVARYGYDPLGRRVEKVARGKTYHYLYDGMDILRETSTDGSTTTIYRYLHGPNIDEPLARQDGSGTITYYHADGLGSIIKKTDASGAVVASYDYDAWGNRMAGSAAPDPYGFTGREWDGAAQLWYYRARWYDSTVGRFISEDPVGFAGGVNLFAYVDNSPVSWRDPWGLTAGAPYDNLGCALIAAFADIRRYPDSLTSREYGGQVYMQGDKYYYTAPKPGSKYDPRDPEHTGADSYPGDMTARTRAIYHSHWNHPLAEDPEQISDQDKAKADVYCRELNLCVPTCVITPRGVTKCYDPRTKKDREDFDCFSFP